MQCFSVDATIFNYFLPMTTKGCSHLAQIFFQYCQPAQNQPKSQFLFHKNYSPRDLCVMTLAESRREQVEYHLVILQSANQSSLRQ